MARVVARIDFDDARLFVDDLRFVIAHPVDLVRDLVEIRLPDRDADRFLAAEHVISLRRCRRSAGSRSPLQRPFRRPALIGKGIEGT